MASVGRMRFELCSRYRRVDPEVLRNKVTNYCLGMPGVDGVTPWPTEVDLVDRLEKLEHEYNYLRSLPKDETEDTAGNSRKRNSSKLSSTACLIGAMKQLS